MELTKFYLPGSRGSLTMNNEESDISSSDRDSSHEEEMKTDPDLVIGFVGSNTDETHYEHVLESIWFDIDLEDDTTLPRLLSDNEIEKSIQRKGSPMLRVRCESIPKSIKSEIILNCVYKHKSSKEEAVRTGMTIQMIENIIYEFKVLEKATEKERKSQSMRHSKVKLRHLKWVQKFVEENSSKGFTLGRMKSHLLADCPDLGDVAVSTLSRLLRKKFNLTYKKLGNSNPRKVIPENKTNLISCLKTIIGLLSWGFHVIFADEFLINRNTIPSYGWWQKGKPGRLFIRPIEFKMSFVVAHSSRRVEGIMGTTTTFNQAKYVKFLKNLLLTVRLNQGVDSAKVVLVVDNCKFHKNNNVKQFITNERVMCIFIPPYSPEINPCEKLINYVKAYVKHEAAANK